MESKDYYRIKTLTSSTLRIAGPWVCLSFMAAGCSAISSWYGGSPIHIHQSQRGSLFLQEVADRSFQADHPAMIDQATLLIIVKGIVTEDVKNLSPHMPVGGSKPMNIFSDEDAEFLAPLLARGLSQAKPDQIVGFTLSSSAGSGTEPAAGTIYRSHGTLYVTISPVGGRNTLRFMPSIAARVERAPAYMADWTPGTTALAIDPQQLGQAKRLAGTSVATGQPSSSHAETQLGAISD